VDTNHTTAKSLVFFPPFPYSCFFTFHLLFHLVILFFLCPVLTLIKKKTKFSLIYKEIQMGSGAKSYMRKGFLIDEEMRKFSPIYMRRTLVIYDYASDPSEFPYI